MNHCQPGLNHCRIELQLEVSKMPKDNVSPVEGKKG